MSRKEQVRAKNLVNKGGIVNSETNTESKTRSIGCSPGQRLAHHVIFKPLHISQFPFRTTSSGRQDLNPDRERRDPHSDCGLSWRAL